MQLDQRCCICNRVGATHENVERIVAGDDVNAILRPTHRTAAYV
jgi:hypothetical protein